MTRTSSQKSRPLTAQQRLEVERRKQVALRMPATSAGRRLLSHHSPVFFDTYYCGMEPVPFRMRWIKRACTLYDEAKRDNDQRKLLLLGPRKHGKTESIITFCLRTVCRDRNVRILIVSNKEGNAKKRLRRIKRLLAKKRVVDDWCSGDPEESLGPFRDKESLWTQTAIEVIRDTDAIDPTVEAVGIGGAITGGHFDIIIFDDVEDPSRVKTAAARKETRDWYEGTVVPMLEPDGFMFVIGTRKHHRDLYAHMMEDASFEVIHDRAFVREPDVIRPIYEVRGGRRVLVTVEFDGGEALWPRSNIGPQSRKRGVGYLIRVKLAYADAKLFAREWNNDVLPDEDRLFRPEWFEASLELGRGLSLYAGSGDRSSHNPAESCVWPDCLVVVQAWDLSLVLDERTALEGNRDFVVGITWGWSPSTDQRFLLGLRRFRGHDPDYIQDAMVEERLRFPRWAPGWEGRAPFVRAVAVERNSFGTIHSWGLSRRMTPYGKLPVVPHLTTGKRKADPHEGLPHMQHVWKTCGVVIPSRTEEDRVASMALREEHEGFGVEDHDDTVMATWIAECVLTQIIAGWDVRERRRARREDRKARREARRAGGGR